MENKFYFSTETAEERKELFSAFVQAWGEMETPKQTKTVKVPIKDKKTGNYTGNSYEFTYADLSDILAACKKSFAKHGLAVIQNPHTTRNANGQAEINIETLFLHVSGHWMKTDKLTYIAQTGMQDFGGQITYLKRYSLAAALGMATEVDDDGNGASGNPSEFIDKSAGNQQGATTSNNKPQGNQSGNNKNAPQGNQGGNKGTTEPKKISEKQKGLIKGKLKSLGSMYDKTSNEMLEHLKAGLNTEFDVAAMTSADASKFISTLIEYEGGKALPEVYPDGKSVTGHDKQAVSS